MAEAVRAAAEDAKVKTADLDGVGIGSPGDVENAAGTVTNAYNVVPDWNRHVQGRGAAPEGARHQDRARKRRAGRDDGRVRAGRRQALLLAPGRLLGHRRRRRHHPERPAVAGPRRRRRDRPHGRAPKRREVHLRREWAAWRPTPGRRAMEIEARHRHKNGEKTALFKIMEKKGRAGAHERSVGRGARARRRARHRADRPGGCGARRRHRLGREPARRRGGGVRRRPGHPPG